MKRSSCISALLVGLSMTVASAALAAPPAAPQKAKKGLVKKTDKKAKQAPEETKAAPETTPADSVVQAQDPPPADPGGGTAPAPAPTTDPAPAQDPAATPTPAPATSEPTPAVTLGTGTAQATDAPQTAPAEPATKEKPRRWAGSSMQNYTSMTTATVFKNQTQDYNPTVDTSFWFAPRYLISKDWQLRGLAVFNYEFTNADDTVTQNEPRFSDTTVGLWYRGIPEIATIKPQIALNMGLPTSPESRARTMVVNPSTTLQLSKEFEHFVGGELMLLTQLSYSHPLYRNTTGEVRGDLPYNRQCISGSTECAGQLSGTFNTSDSLTYALIIVPSWGKFSPGFYYRGRSFWDYTGTRDVTLHDVDPNLNSNKSINTTAQNEPRTKVRQTSYFSVWLDYNANSWLTAEVGYWMERASILTEGSTYGNPFFDRYQDMRVYLGGSIQLDNLIKTFEGGSGEAGIVRAQNTKSPMWNF